jgi:LysR family transcriptional regulator for metE and metH
MASSWARILWQLDTGPKRIEFTPAVEGYLTPMGRLTVDVRDLELVEALAECRGLARAAGRLHVTASALSHQLRQLEERLGAPLFVRGPRHMAPTPAGERLLRAGLPVLRELRQAEDEIGVRDAERRGVLRISVECYASYRWLPAILKPFHDRFPRVEIRVVPDATDSPLDALVDRRLDLAIVGGRPYRDGIRTFALFRDEIGVLLPEHHRLADKAHVDRADLVDARVLAAPGEECGDWFHAVQRIPVLDLMIEMIRQDLGVGLLPGWVAGQAIRDGGLVARRLTRDGTFRDWFVAHREGETPGYLSAFIEALFRRPPANASPTIDFVTPRA